MWSFATGWYPSWAFGESNGANGDRDVHVDLQDRNDAFDFNCALLRNDAKRWLMRWCDTPLAFG